MWGIFLSKARPTIAMRRPSNEIEPKIKPLVDSMNTTGVIKTLASCQGHGSLGKPPYVYFKAPTYIAASIEQLLREAALSDDMRFKEAWVVESQFDENYDLTFLLHSPAYHEKSYSLWAFAYFWLFRKPVDAELLSLAGLVEQAVMLNIRDSDEPQVTASSNGHGKS